MELTIVVFALYGTCSIILLCYGMQCYVLTFLFLRARKAKISSQTERMKFFNAIEDESAYPSVVTQLPMYNEKSVALRIIKAVAAMDYPIAKHEIQILDDSTDETRLLIDDIVSDLKAKGLRISAIRRTERTGFKAGALQNGLRFTNAEYVAIFDADFVPYPDFLKRAIPFFIGRPKLGLVQGRWTHLNSNTSLLTRGQAMGIDGHFMIEQAARSWNKLFMNFNGTAGVFRRTAIESSGGWHHDTLTEDMDLSYRMQINDWETEYVPNLEVPAEIPEDINAFKNQQFRWAKGSIQTAIKVIPMLVKKRMPAFRLVQAILHLTHYTVHPLMLIMVLLTMPVLYLINITMPTALFAVVFLAMLLATSGPTTMYMVSQHYIGNKLGRKIFLIPAMMLIGTGLAVNNGKAVLEALLRRDTPFHRTPKKGDKRNASYRPIKDFTCILELLLGAYCVLSFYMFFGVRNCIVSPFLVLYASGFLFVGILSIVHFNKPELTDLSIRNAILHKSNRV
jgi:cellulose synthase/poly-beta-1,6-N-acetylglucosamine synthase-like glycosyltransferase